MKKCVVEDVGGFLAPLNPPVRRSSRFLVSYLVPAVEDLKFGVDLQFHTRNAPTAQSQIGVGERESAQSVYNRESASALYTFTFFLDISTIGVPTNCIGEECTKNVLKDRAERVKAAVLALGELLKGVNVGGARSSYLPFWHVKSAVALISEPLPLQVVPGHSKRYISATVEFACKEAEFLKDLKPVYTVVYFSEERVEKPLACPEVNVKQANTLGDFLLVLRDEVLKGISS